MNILNTNIDIKDILSLVVTTEKKDIFLKDAINLFLQEKRLRARAGTVNYYTNNLNIIMEFLVSKGIHTVQSINQQTLDSLVYYFKGRGNKNTSINKRIKALLCVISFCEEKELITPVQLKFKRLPEEQTKIEVVDMDDMKKIINYLPGLCIRSQAIILLLFTTGIRTSELINIESENIDFKNLTIYLKFTKSKSARYTPILESVAAVLKELIQLNGGSKWLFPEKDSHISSLAVKSLLRRTKKALNIEVLSAHKLRHLYATTLLKQGTDIKSVSRLLGHKSIRMTERYIDLTDTEIFEKNRINNPLNLTGYNQG